jgi:hypothetical protein
VSVIQDKVRQPIDFANVDLYEGNAEGFDMFSWSPTPSADVAAGKPQAPCTQVHLHGLVSFGRIVWRFKTAKSLDRLIAALIASRVDVWGEPADPKVWRQP